MPSLHEQAQAIAAMYQPPVTGGWSPIGEADKVERLLSALRDGCYLTTASEVAGINRSTLERWLKRADDQPESAYAAFAAAVKEAEAFGELANVRNIKRHSEKEWTASAWLLERKYPERWGRRNEAPAAMQVLIVNPEQVTFASHESLSPPTFASETAQTGGANLLTGHAFASPLRPISGVMVASPEPQEGSAKLLMRGEIPDPNPPGGPTPGGLGYVAVGGEQKPKGVRAKNQKKGKKG